MHAPHTYLAHEEDYCALIGLFLFGNLPAGEFVDRYFSLWKADRDLQWELLETHGREIDSDESRVRWVLDRISIFDPEERRLSGILDRIFTACDSCRELPSKWFEISESELRSEVLETARQRWVDGALMGRSNRP